jgi:hypothetical protein
MCMCHHFAYSKWISASQVRADERKRGNECDELRAGDKQICFYVFVLMTP